MASSQSKFYGTLGIIALAGVALIGYVATRETPEATLATAGPPGAPLAIGELIPLDVGVTKGSEDAPVTVEEYADYQCPYCGMVARLTVPTLVERYVDTGKVRYVFLDFPVHPGDKSYLAAEAARCAGDQDAYWAMHDMLFGRISEWSSRRDPRRKFRDYAEAIGLDGGALKDCVNSRKYRDVVLTNRTRGEQQAVNSTPTFFINGQRVTGAVGFDQLAEVIEEELSKSQ